jgi:hypothetical protein
VPGCVTSLATSRHLSITVRWCFQEGSSDSYLNTPPPPPLLSLQKLLAAWHTAIRRRGEKDSVLEPKPGVEWVPLDPEGKVYGPKGVAELQVS